MIDSNGVATKMEEYVPEAMPTNSARARSRRVSAPRRKLPTNSRLPTGSSVDSEVLIDRMRVWFIASLAIWRYDFLALEGRMTFSLILSKTTTVS